jgi:hypothetical protein
VDRSNCRSHLVATDPVGFLCDHVEVLYDIDIAFQTTARNLGLKLIRAESLNDFSLLMDALEDLALHDKDYSASSSSSSADAFFYRNVDGPNLNKLTV